MQQKGRQGEKEVKGGCLERKSERNNALKYVCLSDEISICLLFVRLGFFVKNIMNT